MSEKPRSVPPCTIDLRPGAELGATRSGGLVGRHHFSFAAYQRADRVQWGQLRALNHYCLEAGAIRPATFHAGFEVLTLVTRGRLRRIGTFSPAGLLVPGSAELVSTGTGANLGFEAVRDATEYLELWIAAAPPLRRARRQYRGVAKDDLGRPLAAGPGPCVGMLRLQANARVSRVALTAGHRTEIAMDETARGYAVVLGGAVLANKVRAVAGDGLAICGPGLLVLNADSDCDLLVLRTTNPL